MLKEGENEEVDYKEEEEEEKESSSESDRSSGSYSSDEWQLKKASAHKKTSRPMPAATRGELACASAHLV